ncbi:uncharacterized protein VTP21DRAFT_2238 [Calcarisporiella thermophila]|uniref:uncharacterized protein n=1 Tax=Calcarisporiella thermophila TaxID=911321 RepID=UPI0037432085
MDSCIFCSSAVPIDRALYCSETCVQQAARRRYNPQPAFPEPRHAPFSQADISPPPSPSYAKPSIQRQAQQLALNLDDARDFRRNSFPPTPSHSADHYFTKISEGEPNKTSGESLAWGQIDCGTFGA